ncbi:GNAT family N-acetyltransferase [Falsiroseomonas selenitidurans]|uniref:GNAT family N-acetyltransferase n=1 Tax=Falsiroseomonas selenitidurans TaxID=2716335 RepID=A0ABX1E975_9PROT|nr:GNAT family N-acetyltransferase [Falsiroseomonas selenitidurans]NKC33769.1 GNAT family N-acetyltransferase [Falsiroseomonas selenitidurans]OYW08941.1 MAG: GNAT family N-acetyltransferase [Rhodospirillales bacterium 12-71-4]
MISIRRARPGDAAAIAAVHVAAWRSAYAGILGERYLAELSEPRLAHFYHRAILDRREGHAVFVATAPAEEAPAQVVGFASGGRARRRGLAEGEVETLYVLDDFRERGCGRRLMRAMAAHLRAIGCNSAMAWVLADNPSRFFYRHLGGRPAMQEGIRVAGQSVDQLALLWDPIDTLLAATAPVPEGRLREGG